MKKLLNAIGVEQIGFYELLIALYPIIMGYTYFIPMELGMLLIILFVSLFKKKRVTTFSLKPVILLYSFIILHEILLIPWLNSIPSYFYNNLLSFVIFLFSLVVIIPRLDYIKLKGSLNLVGLICLLGICYHFILLIGGGSISPIKLPFMPGMDEGSRLYAMNYRPCSFFWEPQSYASFMMIPLFMALKDKKYYWAAAIVISLFMSTSSTGIILSFVMLATYILSQNFRVKHKLYLLVGSAGLLVLLLSSPLLKTGVDKIQNTEASENSRLANGFYLAQELTPSECVLGVTALDAYDYITTFNISTDNLIMKSERTTIYISSFWYVLIKFGVIGLIIYLAVYYKIIVSSRDIIPYVVILICSLFSNMDYVRGLFVFQLLFIYAFVNFHQVQISQTNEK